MRDHDCRMRTFPGHHASVATRCVRPHQYSRAFTLGVPLIATGLHAPFICTETFVWWRAPECEVFNKCRKIQQADACAGVPGCEWDMAWDNCKYTDTQLEFPDRAVGAPNCLVLGNEDCTASNTNVPLGAAQLSPLQDCMWTDDVIRQCRTWSRCYDLGQ